uniref:Trypsin-like peptidase domain-containing protein n=1 Tax=Steinernema glaseri TaxID=37863 RepID=A0A1I7YD49_9BILA
MGMHMLDSKYKNLLAEELWKTPRSLVSHSNGKGWVIARGNKAVHNAHDGTHVIILFISCLLIVLTMACSCARLTTLGFCYPLTFISRHSMLSRVLTIVVLLVLSSSTAATLSFVECPPGLNAIVSVPSQGSVGIRSYHWPNAMTNSDGELRLGGCGFRITSASKQKVGLFFTNAHLLLAQDGDGKQTFDTNDQDYVQAISSDGGKLNFDVQDMKDTTFSSQWTGLEAIVGAYDDESTCPFVTGYNIVTVLEDEPRIAASHWDFSTNSTSIPGQPCVWMYQPEPGYTLKIVFPVFSISEGESVPESVELSEDGTQLFWVVSGDEPSSRVFYTEKGFTLLYTRARRMSGPDASRFVAVISSFLNQTDPGIR